jgi:ABC-type transporter Mla subunit MlaD
MNKKLVAVVLAVAFALGTAGVSMAAKGNKCEVTAIDGNTVTLECAKTKGLKVGSKVTVKKARKAIEGC